MKKMSKIEAGNLGGEATRRRYLLIKEVKTHEYLKNPKFCLNAGCDLIIPYEKRKTNIFCSSSCSAIFNNKNRPRIIKICQLPTCNNLIDRQAVSFCSRKCYNNNKLLESFKCVENGNAEERIVKKYLLHHYGNICFECGITSWQGKELKMDLDHIDGNSDNNTLENCRLLCPNCHRQTPTYKGGNKKDKKNKDDQRNIRRRAAYKKQTGASIRI